MVGGSESAARATTSRRKVSLIGGGEVRPEYYPVLARYQRMAIQAYQAQSVPIYALTPQNEPLVVPTYPSGT